MRVAVLVRPEEHHSLGIYRNAVLPRMEALGLRLRPFAPNQNIPPDCELIWDPGLGMRPVPPVLFDATLPVVVTVLGLRTFAVPIESVAPTAEWVAWEQQLKADVQTGWASLRPRLAGVITISRACAAEVATYLGVPRRNVQAIHLAVERDVFRPAGEVTSVPRDHILHIALAGPARKNLPRMLEAYALLPRELRIPFLIKMQEDPGAMDLPDGVRIEREHCPVEQLVDYYRRARCLLFPSIYEGFGLPILEAMQCGCPVITSHAGACAEVAGTAARLVDPHSTREMAAALERVLRDDAFALDLAQRGLRRAEDFSWDRCAQEHVAVLQRFQRAARRREFWRGLLLRRT